MKKQYRKKIPPSVKTAASLRNSDYTLSSMVSDIIDNSFDAGAKNIDVSVTAKNNKNYINQIIFTDDGCGMNIETLEEAIRYGSESEYGEQSVGNYGLGMNTAATSQGRRLTVYTKQEDGEMVQAVCDLDVFDETRDYNSDMATGGTKEEIEWFNNRLEEFTGQTVHGTIVIVDKLDRCKKRKGNVLQTLRNPTCLARTYAYNTAAKLTIQGKEIERNGFATEFIYTGTEEIPQGWRRLVKGKDKVETDYFFRVYYPKGSHEGVKGGVMRTQGIDLLVANRNVVSVPHLATHEVWTHSHKTSGLIVQIKYDGDQKDIYREVKEGGDFTVGFQKDNVRFSDNFITLLKENVNPFINKLVEDFDNKQSNASKNNTPAANKLKQFEDSVDTSVITSPEINNETCLAEPEPKVTGVSNINNKSKSKPSVTHRGEKMAKKDVWKYEILDFGRHGRAWEKPSFEDRGTHKVITARLNAAHPWIAAVLKESPTAFRLAMAVIMASSSRELASGNPYECDTEMAELSNGLTESLNSSSSCTSWESENAEKAIEKAA